MKSILKYSGAKNKVAPWICGHIPRHSVYLEPYFGSGAVFFNKDPARIEILNDIDGDVVNYFRMVRDRPQELCRLIRNTPFARDEYYAAFEVDDNTTDIERARRFAVRCWQGIGGQHYRNGFKVSKKSNGSNNTKIWIDLPERIDEASERIMHAHIENLPAVEIINRYNTADVFMYIDPPYLLSTRKNYLYRYEMSDADHMELLELLKRHHGKILISGYENEIYNAMLAGWNKACKTTQAEGGLIRMETIWMNYEHGQMRMADITEYI